MKSMCLEKLGICNKLINNYFFSSLRIKSARILHFTLLHFCLFEVSPLDDFSLRKTFSKFEQLQKLSLLMRIIFVRKLGYKILESFESKASHLEDTDQFQKLNNIYLVIIIWKAVLYCQMIKHWC
jgi:hypothetical protein